MLGTATVRQRTTPPPRADGFADIELPDHDGRMVRLGDLWRDQPAVLVWLRHYGWTFCRAHAVQLHRDRVRFAEAGARLVLIGQATSPHAAHFRRTQGIALPVLADAARLSYKAAGAKIATMDELLGPVVVAKGVIAIAKHRVFQGRQVGDFAQLGGAMIIGVDGTIVWSHMSEDASDIASPAQILQVLASEVAKTTS